MILSLIVIERATLTLLFPSSIMFSLRVCGALSYFRFLLSGYRLDLGLFNFV